MKVPFLDLSQRHRPYRDEVLARWAEIYDTSRFVSGPEVQQFEIEFAAAHEVEHCVAVGTGTEALTLAVRGLGLRPGDRVVVPANTFIATAEAVSNAGGTPVFVDCDPAGRSIDVAATAEALRRSGAVGVIPVHLYGRPADMDGIRSAASAAGAWVLEDAAQAHLARYRSGPVGGLGDAAAFSFYPGKNLGAPGEGGAITTNDDTLATTLRKLRDHGQAQKYHSDLIGTNGRMHEMSAVMLRHGLRHLRQWNDGRRRVALWYRERLSGQPDIQLPDDPDWAEQVYHLFVVEIPHRDRVKAAVEQAGIGVGLHYPVPIHLQDAYAHMGHRAGDFPNAERSAVRLLSLPMFGELTEDQVDYVSRTLIGAVDEAGSE
jgi:dTDP-4-amino-4,6-dideoxygalactose transaminase